jgi:hypothetical protein
MKTKSITSPVDLVSISNSKPLIGMISVIVLCTLLAHGARAKVEYDSNQLLMKNAEEISELVRKKIKRAQEIQAKQEESSRSEFLAEPEAVEELKAALRIVLARPDQDGTRANAFARLRRELSDLHSFDKVLADIAKEGISHLKDSSTTPRRCGTYIVLLNNLMAELKPEIATNKNFKKVIEEIRDAEIKVTQATKNETAMRSLPTPVSPSEIAEKILPKESGK